MSRAGVDNLHYCPYCGLPTRRDRACANCGDLPAVDPYYVAGLPPSTPLEPPLEPPPADDGDLEDG